VLKAKGIDFEIGVDPEKEVIGSKYPFGRVFHTGTEFEENHGEQPKYVTDVFLVRVYLKDTSERFSDLELKKWSHNIREAVTIGALNVGGLAVTKYVSRIQTNDITIEVSEGVGVLDYELQVRYREI
jgi:hypothetical protein